MILAAPGNGGPLNHIQTDTASAEHRDTATGTHLCGVGRGAHPGRNAAANQRRFFQRDILFDGTAHVSGITLYSAKEATVAK